MQKLVNQQRAMDIMEREGLDALVAQLPVNSYYLSSYWGLFNRAVGYDGSYFAILPRDPDAPSALIVPAADITQLATESSRNAGTWMTSVYAYSSPADSERTFPDGTPQGLNYAGFPAAEAAPAAERESNCIAMTERLGESMSPNSFWAVARALKAAGLEQAKIGADDARTASWLHDSGMDKLSVRYCPQLFNEVRLVKTPAEIEILRQAAHINEMSLLLAADVMQAGSTREELETMYMLAMAQQGGHGIALMCGAGDLPAGQVRPSEPVSVQALGQYQHYYGDFGRCAVVGEPSKIYRRRHAHLLLGWETARDKLQPRVTYRELARAVGAEVRKAGLKDFRDPVVRSLGLQHSDDFRLPGMQPEATAEQVLEPDMIVNVDLSYTELGWGSIQLEDTVRITTYGHERLSQTDMRMRVAGAGGS